MKITQIVFLGVALAAGAAAFMMSNGAKPPPAKIVTAAAPQIPTDDVLVAAHDLPMGTLVKGSDMIWQPWPKKSLGQGMITKSADPGAMIDVGGSVTRASFVQGEPMFKEKLVKGPNSGFLSAILPSGYRAVAINIDAQGATTAGGFILPNDRVDVIRTAQSVSAQNAGGQTYASKTILRDIRVLAIGQNVQEKNAQRVVVGSNATLEVTPAQADLLAEAQRDGQLSLSLRSMLDANKAPTPLVDSDKSITVVRYGVARSSATN